MTSIAFILGVLPLALSTGAGANSKNSIGMGVVGGMLTATFVSTVFVPFSYCWVSRLGLRKRGIKRARVIGNSCQE